MTTQSKEAGIKTLVMLDEQGGKSASVTDVGGSVSVHPSGPSPPWFLLLFISVTVGEVVILLFVLS